MVYYEGFKVIFSGRSKSREFIDLELPPWLKRQYYSLLCQLATNVDMRAFISERGKKGMPAKEQKRFAIEIFNRAFRKSLQCRDFLEIMRDIQYLEIDDEKTNIRSQERIAGEKAAVEEAYKRKFGITETADDSEQVRQKEFIQLSLFEIAA